MRTLYIASSHAYSGKALLTLALAQRYQQRGINVGYFRPLGTFAVQLAGTSVDGDAAFARGLLGLSEPMNELCPLLLTEEVVAAYLDGSASDLKERVLAGFHRVSTGRDLMVVGGAGRALSRGALLGLTGPAVAAALDARVLLVGLSESLLDLDALVATAASFGRRLVGVIMNRVASERVGWYRDRVFPALRETGIPVLGVLPADELLRSVSVQELARSLKARVLCAEESLGQVVRRFRVGAMTLESALAHFRLDERKAVITGGDRSDIILAALQTPTVCLVLTGDLMPSPAVRARAAELGVPMLLVAQDTISTVGRIETLMSGLRVREPQKVARARELLEEYVDLETLDRSLALESEGEQA